MSTTATITVSNYAADRFARLSATLAKDGLKLVGNSGEVKEHGADVTYGYNLASQTLTLVVLHGPHFVNFQSFVDKLKAFVETQE